MKHLAYHTRYHFFHTMIYHYIKCYDVTKYHDISDEVGIGIFVVTDLVHSLFTRSEAITRVIPMVMNIWHVSAYKFQLACITW